MKQLEAFELLTAFAEKHDALIVADIGSQSLWLKAVKDRVQNLYLSGPMGQASSVALGVAAAQKERLVIAACGDGALGMNMTSLATISYVAPKNLIVAVMDNGVYEFTKGLPTPTLGVKWAKVPGTFPGFKKTFAVDALDTISDPFGGPYFIHADIEPGPLPPGPGLPAVIAHDRFKNYLTGAAKTTASPQQC
ncbi:MAG: thiamine pyrophosphate-dependent enzyme [Alphaproteobacteria bacterium]|nr:thiamine pyrophosphate-dependent enzyme [Alphaproteobacteria bacterium]MCD8520068.1 thiamine pyrophosphate-dependent enzyme [Alphaproteobacteria bacterium]MCD8525668.1 thiamine pyrophosphate-dependent enzyme [Alphaproteobacteria bacterium]MCD8570940.1 thiamine pyrophosphate-dependent enzyme [Alphaproteobacteria bacterium]